MKLFQTVWQWLIKPSDVKHGQDDIVTLCDLGNFRDATEFVQLLQNSDIDARTRFVDNGNGPGSQVGLFRTNNFGPDSEGLVLIRFGDVERAKPIFDDYQEELLKRG